MNITTARMIARLGTSKVEQIRLSVLEEQHQALAQVKRPTNK